MTEATKKAAISVAVNTAIFCVSLIIVQLQGLTVWWGLPLVAVLKAGQQVLARWSTTGGEQPSVKRQ